MLNLKHLSCLINHPSRSRSVTRPLTGPRHFFLLVSEHKFRKSCLYIGAKKKKPVADPLQLLGGLVLKCRGDFKQILKQRAVCVDVFTPFLTSSSLPGRLALYEALLTFMLTLQRISKRRTAGLLLRCYSKLRKCKQIGIEINV